MKWPRMHAVVGVKVPQDVFEWMIGQFDSGLGSGVCEGMSSVCEYY